MANIKTRPCRCCDGTGTELDPVKFGAEMRQLRQARDLSATQVAHKMGVTVSYVSDLEWGKRNWNQERIDLYKKACQ